jgi:hypothetical protein
MKKVLIKWIDRKNGEIIVRRFNGFLESETEETVSFKYNKTIVTRKKSECIFF